MAKPALDLPKSLPRVPKLKNYLCEGEREKAEETCIVASWERGHSSEAHWGGQNSAHPFWPIAVEHFA